MIDIQGVKTIKIGEEDEFELYRVGANRYMGYHPILKTSHDYTMALSKALEISEKVELSLNKKLREMKIDEEIEILPYR